MTGTITSNYNNTYSEHPGWVRAIAAGGVDHVTPAGISWGDGTHFTQPPPPVPEDGSQAPQPQNGAHNGPTTDPGNGAAAPGPAGQSSRALRGV
jgi:hypothetical protein